jgi:hypothetical protein
MIEVMTRTRSDSSALAIAFGNFFSSAQRITKKITKTPWNQ